VSTKLVLCVVAVTPLLDWPVTVTVKVPSRGRRVGERTMVLVSVARVAGGCAQQSDESQKCYQRKPAEPTAAARSPGKAPRPRAPGSRKAHAIGVERRMDGEIAVVVEAALVISTMLLVGGQAEAGEPLAQLAGVAARIWIFSGVKVQDA